MSWTTSLWREVKEIEEEVVKETTEPPKKKPNLQKVDAALEDIQDWIEMTEDTKISFPAIRRYIDE